MNKFRILEKMKIESSPQLTKPKRINQQTVRSKRTNKQPPNNSVELSGLNTIKKCLTEYLL